MCRAAERHRHAAAGAAVPVVDAGHSQEHRATLLALPLCLGLADPRVRNSPVDSVNKSISARPRPEDDNAD